MKAFVVRRCTKEVLLCASSLMGKHDVSLHH
jgi:hypothetical protein